MSEEKLYDVLEVSIRTSKVLGLMGERKTERNAEAIERMAVMRRGLKTSIYVTVPTGSKKVGDTYGARA